MSKVPPVLKHKIQEVNFYPPGSKIAHINFLIYSYKLGYLLCEEKLRIQRGKMHIKFMVVILEFDSKLPEHLDLELIFSDFKHEKTRKGPEVNCKINIHFVCT